MNVRASRLAVVLTLALGLACGAAAGADLPRIDHAALNAAPDRYIVAGIDNDRPAAMPHAGSSPRGYDGLIRYGPSPRARRLLQDIERDYRLREISAWPIEALHMHCAVLQIPEGADRDALLASLANDPRVRLAQPLQTFETRSQSYNDPYVSLQRGFQQMNVADAHLISGGEGVRIAIIDTGADLSHPDLRGRVFKAVNVVDADDAQFNRDRHGTEMAGVIAAVANNRVGIVGIAPRAELVIVKACWQLRADADPAQCNSFTLAKGLVAALDAGANVINLSLAGPADPLLHQLISAGLRRGVLFVGAAPADLAQAAFMHHTGVIEVAGVESAHQSDARVYAPGRDILTLLPGNRYDFASGSSLATAQVSGIVALMLSRHPALTADQAREFLQRPGGRVVSTVAPPGAGADGLSVASAGAQPGSSTNAQPAIAADLQSSASSSAQLASVDACAALAAAAGYGRCPPPDAPPERVAGTR